MRSLIYIEQKDGSPLGSSLELITAAHSLGDEAVTVLIGDVTEEQAVSVAGAGADRVYLVPMEEPLTEDHLTGTLVWLAGELDPDLILASATTTGKVIIPRIGSRLNAGTVNDVVSIERGDRGCRFSRTAFGGTVFEVREVTGRLAAVSVRGGSYEKTEEAESAAPIERITPEIPADALKTRITEIIEDMSEEVDLEAAKVIVSVGRGLGNETDFPLIQQLAESFGGAIGGSRPVIESGLIPRQQQVGQSGKIVTPELYIAIAISGAPQHLAGMSGSKYIIAINKDEDAPIFRVADVGIVGDAKKIIPPLIEAVKQYRNS